MTRDPGAGDRSGTWVARVRRAADWSAALLAAGVAAALSYVEGRRAEERRERVRR